MLRDADAPSSSEVQTRDGRWLMMRLRPYRTIDDRIDGVVVTFVDITERRETTMRLRESEERQSFLLTLSDALRPVADPDEIEGEACRLLAERMDVDRAYYVEVNEVTGVARIRRDFVRDGTPSLAGEHPVADFAWSIRILRRGDCHVIPDTQTSPLVPEEDRATSRALQIVACMGAPLIKGGRLVGALCVTSSTPREWQRHEVAMLRELADRIWAAIQRAQAEAAMRESEERFRALTSATSDVIFRMAADWTEVREFGGRGLPDAAGRADDDWLASHVLPEDQPRVRALIDEAIRLKTPLELEHRGRRPDGSIGWTLSRSIPILDGRGEIVEWFGAASDITERRENEERLREARDALTLATQASQLGWGKWNFATGEAEWDARGREIFGLAVGQTAIEDWLERVHPDDRQAVETEVSACVAENRPFDLEYRVIHPDGTEHRIHGTGVFELADGADAPLGTGLVRDVTEMRKWEEAQRLLVGELNHRVKNMLAIVQSIARQTQRTTTSIEDFTTAFEQRVQAVASAHSILTQRHWSSANLADLAREILGSFTSDEDRLHHTGPRIELRPDAAISFAMALHELATNAMKHGALSVPEGRVDVSWDIDKTGHVVFEWVESGGPEVHPPTRRGFGSRLLERGIARELDGEVQLDYRPEGIRCRVEFRIDQASAKTIAAASRDRG